MVDISCDTDIIDSGAQHTIESEVIYFYAKDKRRVFNHGEINKEIIEESKNIDIEFNNTNQTEEIYFIIPIPYYIDITEYTQEAYKTESIDILVNKFFNSNSKTLDLEILINNTSQINYLQG